MDGIEEGVHEANGHSSDFAPAQHSGYLARLLLVQRLDHPARVVDALRHDQPVPPADVRRGRLVVHVPEILLGAAADLDHIAKSPGQNHGRPRQPTRHKGVGCHRRAVREESNVAEVDAALLEAVDNAVDWVQRRRHLRDCHGAVRIVQDADIGKRPPNVHGHSKTRQPALLPALGSPWVLAMFRSSHATKPSRSCQADSRSESCQVLRRRQCLNHAGPHPGDKQSSRPRTSAVRWEVRSERPRGRALRLQSALDSRTAHQRTASARVQCTACSRASVVRSRTQEYAHSR